MTDTEIDPLAAFVRTVVAQLEKNGFPDRKVSFPIERLYDSAYAKGVNFNRVLDELAAIGIAHEKTSERVIFSRDVAPEAFPDGSPFAGLDASALAGMSKDQLLAAAAEAMKQLGPEQLAAMQAMVERLTPDERDAMVEQARKLGLA